MTREQFLILCNRYTVAPEVALENQDLVTALRAKDQGEVERILREDF